MTKSAMDLRTANNLAEQGDPSDEQYWQTMRDLTGLGIDELVPALVKEGVLEPVPA